MRRAVGWKIGLGVSLGAAGLAGIVVNTVSCGTAPTPFIVQGPGQFGNEAPTLTFLEPETDITFGQGDPFLIRWTDTDRDDNAQISFSLLSTTSTDTVSLVTDIDENDSIGPDSFTVPTTLIPPGTYNLVGTIDDGVNAPVEVFAVATGTAVLQRILVTIVEPGQGPQTVPPIITVTEPAFNRSVAQEDILTVSVQPTALAPNDANPFDPDSDVRLFILFDLDQDPNNDDPANPDPSLIIVRIDQVIPAGAFEARTFDIRIDLAVIPPRPGGEPYFIRATIDDATNPRVHHYAAGTISVVQLASGTVDLFDIGRSKSGAKWQGFNPGANLGSSISTVSDFDADGIADFVVVAQFGNPQNAGPVGEAYLIYGQDRIRFGGTIPVNSVSETVSGAIFQAPPVRTSQIPDQFPDDPARTDGITDVSFVRDLNGDGRPEILLGLPHVHGAYDSTDYDPGDDDPTAFGCYPDFLVNNFTDTPSGGCFFHTGCDRDVGFYGGGMAVVVNSTNRDNDGRIIIEGEPDRLDTTSVVLELTGHLRILNLDNAGLGATGNILVRADNITAGDVGDDPVEAGRIAGARFIAGGFDYVLLSQPPRNGLFGQSVRSLGDLNADGLDEIIISAPRNERYLDDLLNDFGFLGTHLISTVYIGSIMVLPGTNYNQEFWRDMEDDTGTSRIPILTNDFGDCTSAPPEARRHRIPAEAFDIFAEDIDDMLGEGQSAGDFNRDGIDDILCGAPLNDRNAALPDTGATYIIYGRLVFGEVNLREADEDPALRPPMLRIRGLNRGDQIGWRQTAGLDVNGDGLDDVFIASPRTDFGGVIRPISTCGGDFNGDNVFDTADLTQDFFDACRASAADELFSDDSCKVFDYDTDGDIDFDDECVFCCLSTACVVDSACVFGREADCCANLVDNGFVGILFGGVLIDGDRDLAQLATSQLPGTIFFGTGWGDRAGLDVSSAGDFNQDGFGDILITAPGEVRVDAAGRERLGVVYLIFGGPHLINSQWDLKDVSEALPGIVFLSPYVKGRPNEAAPTTVAFVGDINNDGFGDIAIGNPKADFIDLSFPQGPDAPGSDPAAGRRSDVGDAYIVYGNNFGSNRALP